MAAAVALTAAELASTIIPLIIDATASSSSTDTSASTRTTAPTAIMDNSAYSGSNLDVDHVLANSALPPRPAFFDIPRDLGPSLVLPFQIEITNWKGDPLLEDFDLAANTKIRALLLPYRYAQLESLAVIVLPAQSSAVYPGTVDIRYITSDVTPSANDMIEHPGAVRITMGGPLGVGSNSSVPCNLRSFSPVIKSPFLPTDRIKIAVNHWLNADATTKKPDGTARNTHVLITTLARGTIRVGYPNNG